MFPGTVLGSSARTSTNPSVKKDWIHSLVIGSATELLLAVSHRSSLVDLPFPVLRFQPSSATPALVSRRGSRDEACSGCLVQGLAPSAKRLPTRRRALPPRRYLPQCSPGFPSCHPTGARPRGLVPCRDAMTFGGVTHLGDRSPLRVPPPLGLLPSPRATGASEETQQHPLMVFQPSSRLLCSTRKWGSGALAATDRLQRLTRE
jgi:hypothetical protein